MVKKGIEIRLYPNKGQRNFINKMIGAVRVVYNTMLYRKEKYYEEHKESLNVLPTDLYTEYLWLKELDSQGFCNVYMDLNKAYNNWFNSLKGKNKGKFKAPKYKNKSHSGSYKNGQPIKIPNKLIDLQNHTIKLPKLKYVKFKGNVDLDRIKKIYNVTIKKTNTNKYFCSICCDYEVPDYEQTDAVVGLDLGIKDLIITSDGQKFENKKFYRNNEKKIKHLQRELSRKKKGSRNHDKARLKHAIAHEKLSNCRKDYIQKLTTKLVKDYSVICIEDLAVSNMMKNHKLAKSISDCSFSMIRQMTAARSSAQVGLPTWSATTPTSGRVAISDAIVLTKFFPYGEYSQAVRIMIALHPDPSSSSSPASLVRPYTPRGFLASSSLYGILPSPPNT